MEKRKLVFLFSIVLYSLISISLAQADCVITVQYKDGCPTEGAEVWVEDPYQTSLGYTDSDGKVSCDSLNPGDYWIAAYFDFGLFADGDLTVNGSGYGRRTLTGADNYPSKACGDSECYGMSYCDSGVIKCDSWDTECDSKKCCQCDGGTYANPTEKEDLSQNEDCNPFDIATCDWIPDDYHFTWDFRDSYCTGLNMCYETITHTCNDDDLFDGVVFGDGCDAECDEDIDCASGICQADCTCAPDTNPPEITVNSPQSTYYTRYIEVSLTIDEPTSWIGYSLDNQPNITLWIDKPAGTHSKYITVSYGNHNIIFYANDTFGNMGTSERVYFTVRLAMGGGCAGPAWIGCRLK